MLNYRSTTGTISFININQKKKEKKRKLSTAATNGKSDQQATTYLNGYICKFFQESGFLGSGTCFLSPPLLFLPRIGLSNFFRTLLNPDTRQRLCFPWFKRGIVGVTLTCLGCDTCLGNPGSDRLLCSMALLRWVSKESLSNWSKRVLCSSPNLFRIFATSSIACCFWNCCCNIIFFIHGNVALEA